MGWPIKMLFVGEFGIVVAWLVGAAFIPSLALFAGIWSGSSKLFEVVYFMLWYVGALNQTPLLDFIGITGELHNSNTTILFILLTITLLFLTIVGRRVWVSR